jgi:hypothetical protein
LRPPLQRRFTVAVQPIHAALGALEPTINVAEQNTAGIRGYGSKIARAGWSGL